MHNREKMNKIDLKIRSNVTLSKDVVDKLKKIKSVNGAALSASIRIAVDDYYKKLFGTVNS